MNNNSRVIACKWCGKKFNAVEPNSRYCSPECRKQYEKTKYNEWLDKNPDYFKNYNRARRKAKKERAK